jgi:hypothetical protein
MGQLLILLDISAGWFGALKNGIKPLNDNVQEVGFCGFWVVFNHNYGVAHVDTEIHIIHLPIVCT